MDESKYKNNQLSELALLVVDNIDAMLAYWDKNCICKFVNKAYQLWFGKNRNEIIGIHIEQLLGTELYNKNLKFINEALMGHLQVFEREITIPTGETRHSITTYTPHIVDGVVKGFFVHDADSSVLKKAERELEEEKAKALELATHDFLTELPNRILLMDRFESAVEYSKRNNEVFCIMSMDLDDFKVVNDNLGHAVGDKLLKEIANRVQNAVRKNDTVSRIGGDEFILLSTNIKTKSDAEIMAKRILNTFNKPFDFLNNSEIKPGISIGIAFYPINGENFEDLAKSADSAMYLAKKSGKNRFEVV